MEAHGIRHYVIEMQGTKKVDIPEHIMNQIMRISLDKENHPLLIHCNHGKVINSDPLSGRVQADQNP